MAPIAVPLTLAAIALVAVIRARVRRARDHQEHADRQ
jgi:hypothetical protein